MRNELPDEAGGPDAGFVRVQIRNLLIVVFLVFLGQSTLNPVLAPLTRELGLYEWQAGAIMSASALMIFLTSRFWGRRSQSSGRKQVLLVSAGLATFALLLFGVFAQLGSLGIVTGTLLFALLAVTRGLMFGTATSAVFPTAQAFITDVTYTERQRVRGMAGLGTVQGMTMIGGSVVGGLLASIGLISSLILIPLAPAAAFLFVVFGLKKERASELVEHALKVRVLDSRVWPFVTVSIGVFTAFNTLQIAVGFLLQDQFDFEQRIVSMIIGGTLVAGGIGMLIAQGIVVPRSGWRPVTLMRVGTGVLLASFAVLLVWDALPVLVVCVFFTGVGAGLALPGAISAPTLLVEREEQGGLAGTMNSMNGLSWMATPILSTMLYALTPHAPIVVSLVIMAAVFVFTLSFPRFRQPLRMPA